MQAHAAVPVRAGAKPHAACYQWPGVLPTYWLASSRPNAHALRQLETSLSLRESCPCRCCPRYDKSAFQGQGDRADPATWPAVEGPVDVVLFEGWMLVRTGSS